MNVKDIVLLGEELAPLDLACDFDKVGLQVGSVAAPVTGILVTLDVTREAVQAAERKGCDLIISHHPLIFRELVAVRPEGYPGELIYRLVRHDINLLAWHTNFDACRRGTSVLLAELLDVRNTIPLCPADERFCKFVVFVPVSHIDAVRAAATSASAGMIGDYADCAFMSPGVGTFRPLAGAAPYCGAPGELERVPEIRLETLVNRRDIGAVIENVRSVHPYEEMAYDVYPVENLPAGAGIGVVGTLARAVELKTFARRVKKALGADGVQVAGRLSGTVKRVAIASGSGGADLANAIALGADLLVTGELKHAEFIAARHAGLAVIAAGHFHSENIFVAGVASFLKPRLPKKIKLARFAGRAPYVTV